MVPLRSLVLVLEPAAVAGPANTRMRSQVGVLVAGAGAGAGERGRQERPSRGGWGKRPVFEFADFPAKRKRAGVSSKPAQVDANALRGEEQASLLKGHAERKAKAEVRTREGFVRTRG